MKKIDKYRGCLIGGAIGDALGYPIEFDNIDEIKQKYGENGINEYELQDGVALISDDTQMTLYTANGLLLGRTRYMTRGIMGPYEYYIELCYKDWLKTQTAEFMGYEPGSYSWLNNIPEMNYCREPGRTCINYLAHDNLGNINNPKNNSKGCGGVMRVAPIGLYFDCDSKEKEDKINTLGANAAALTHGHELGYITAAFLVHVIRLLSHNDSISILEAVKDAQNAIKRIFNRAVHIDELLNLIDYSIELAQTEVDDLSSIEKLGEGWVAEETLAIAIYCSIKYENDFEKAVITAVNHSGDSDSTGSITGQIVGVYLGLSKIPEKYIRNLELKDTILEVADDLYNDCKISEYGNYHDEIWENKYIYHTYPTKTK